MSESIIKLSIAVAAGRNLAIFSLQKVLRAFNNCCDPLVVLHLKESVPLHLRKLGQEKGPYSSQAALVQTSN